MEFIRQNAQILSAFASVGSLFIWTLYAVLFYKGFKRQRSAHIFIHAAGDGGPGTECVVINLSPEPVHLLCSVVDAGEAAVQIQGPRSDELPIKARVKQGPLDTGEMLSLGRFDQIADEIEAKGEDVTPGSTEQRIEIRVAAIHGLSDRPIGAVRGFYLNLSEGRIVAEMPHTEQLRSRRQSWQVQRWMQECGSYREDMR